MKAKFNHLRNYYSDFNLYFLNHFYNELNINMNVCDIGCGHLRNLRLFNSIGFKNLYGVDWNTPNPNFNINDFSFTFFRNDITNGIPLPDNFSDITLCNYVLMFIDEINMCFVLNELYRITSNFLIIETYELHSNAIKNQNGTDFKNFSFDFICNYLSNNCGMKIILRKYPHKIILKKVNHGKG